jgi:protein tyrosine/serine phosphatase
MFPKTFLFASLSLAAPMFAAANVDVPGVGNFHQVDSHVFRGAQPTDRGFENLSKLGIKTVVDLQEPGTRGTAEAKVVTGAGMQYVSVPMKGMSTPSDASVTKVLALLEDNATGPIFVHCHRGADRTGAVIACYRIEHDHWENEKALSEARTLGMSWFQVAIQHYVKGFTPRSAAPETHEVIASDQAPLAPSSPALALVASPAN